MHAAKLLLTWSLAVLLSASAQEIPKPESVEITVVDETGAAVAAALLTIQAANATPVQIATDFAGHAEYSPQSVQPYRLHAEKTGYFQADAEEDSASLREIRLILPHLQTLVQNIDVHASPSGIDPQQLSDKSRMNAPDIVNLPYPTSRDIRQLLQFFPGVVQDPHGQVHVAGSASWSILYALDGFDIRSPFNGSLSMRFSADAVLSIEKEATRYPVEYGRNTGGVIAFKTGMGDDKFRFNVTDFVPQFQELNGLKFDKFAPRLTMSGPIRRNRAWFFDGVETELKRRYVPQLTSREQTDFTVRGSNLLRAQWNVKQGTIMRSGLLVNDYHTGYEGLSPAVPQQSTTKHNIVAGMPHIRLQQRLHGALLDFGIGVVRFKDATRPYVGDPFSVTPEGARGAHFETQENASQSVQSDAMLYLPTRQWFGHHDLKAGLDVNDIRFTELVTRSQIQYLREDRSLLRLSTFSRSPAFTGHNLATGAYVQDQWTTGNRWLIEPGLRFDWNEITRRPNWSPRLAAAVMPGMMKGAMKIGAGIGIYHEQIPLDYLARAEAGGRVDRYYASDGVTPVEPPLQTAFTYDESTLRQPYAINWSVGLEERLPGSVYVKVNYINKRILHGFSYVNQDESGVLGGTYMLTNSRKDWDKELDIEARHIFRGGYSLFGAYTRSSAWTNAVLDYSPTLSVLGPQQSGPEPWDTPNNVISGGWLPVPLGGLRKRWDLVYTLNWHSGFPYTALNANQQVVGAANGFRFPDYLAFNPGIEWKLHVHGSYFGLRGVVENATDAADPFFVNNNVDSPQFGHFYKPPGRTFSVRIRLIESKHKNGIIH